MLSPLLKWMAFFSQSSCFPHHSEAAFDNSSFYPLLENSWSCGFSNGLSHIFNSAPDFYQPLGILLLCDWYCSPKALKRPFSFSLGSVCNGLMLWDIYECFILFFFLLGLPSTDINWLYNPLIRGQKSPWATITPCYIGWKHSSVSISFLALTNILVLD